MRFLREYFKLTVCLLILFLIHLPVASGYQAPAAGQAQVPQATLSAAQLQEQQKVTHP